MGVGSFIAKRRVNFLLRDVLLFKRPDGITANKVGAICSKSKDISVQSHGISKLVKASYVHQGLDAEFNIRKIASCSNHPVVEKHAVDSLLILSKLPNLTPEKRDLIVSRIGSINYNLLPSSEENIAVYAINLLAWRASSVGRFGKLEAEKHGLPYLPNGSKAAVLAIKEICERNDSLSIKVFAADKLNSCLCSDNATYVKMEAIEALAEVLPVILKRGDMKGLGNEDWNRITMNAVERSFIVELKEISNSENLPKELKAKAASVLEYDEIKPLVDNHVNTMREGIVSDVEELTKKYNSEAAIDEAVYRSSKDATKVMNNIADVGELIHSYELREPLKYQFEQLQNIATKLSDAYDERCKYLSVTVSSDPQSGFVVAKNRIFSL